MYNSLRYCLCSDIVIRLSFFPKFSHLQPHSHLHVLQPNFSENTAMWYLTCMHCPKLIIYSKTSNQIKLQMWLLLWVTSFPVCPGPAAKFLFSCTSTQNAKNIHMKCLPRVNFTSLALDKLQNSISIGYVSKIMTESIRSMCNLCCESETSITNFP